MRRLCGGTTVETGDAPKWGEKFEILAPFFERCFELCAALHSVHAVQLCAVELSTDLQCTVL
jgi:hypothetical protein